MRRFAIGQLTLALIGMFTFCVHLSAQQPDRDRDRTRDEGEDLGEFEGLDSDRMNPRLVPSRPGRPDRDTRWYLGVEVAYAGIGAQVTSVDRQSPARLAGLESRDVILTVSGYQVGRVNGRLFPLERELDLRADRLGGVTLLVQNRRNGQLAVVPVRLDPAQRRREPTRVAPIVGTVNGPRTTRIPRNAVLTVRLLDVTERRRPPSEITQQTYRDLGPFPIPFELPYDPDQIRSERAYALDAEITANGRTTLRTGERYPVLETDRQPRVHLTLEPAR